MHISVARERYVHWLSAVRDLSPHTVRAYSGDLMAFEQYLGPGATIAEIDRRRLLAFIESQREAGLSVVSIKRRASALRGFYRWLRAKELIADDSALDLSIAPARTRQLPRVVPPFELQRLLVYLRQKVGFGDAIDERAIFRNPHHATTLLAVALMLATGVRVQEVVGIRSTDIDVWSRSLRLLGKGRREREVYLTNRWVTGLTQSYLIAREHLGISHDRLLFNRHLLPLTPPAMRGRLVKVADEAGLRCRVTPHMLRHSAATQLIEAGVDIRYIQRLLGHASLSTTEIYTHVSDAALRRAVSDADVLGRLGASDN
jgi:site-specific recombinase XerD